MLGVGSYYLTPQEVAILEKASRTETDGKAAYRLHEYHAFYMADPATGRVWLAKAASQGHTAAMDTLKHLEASSPAK